MVVENIGVARAGYDYAAAHFAAFVNPLPKTENRYAILSGNMRWPWAAQPAGVKFYCAYPMSPSTGVSALDGGAARKAGIMVAAGGGRDWRDQYDDRRGSRRCPRDVRHLGSGFALMSEGLGMSAMIETPVVVINCQRAAHPRAFHEGPNRATSGRCWRRFWRLSPSDRGTLDIGDCFQLIPEMFNIVDRFQCPGLCFAICCYRRADSA